MGLSEGVRVSCFGHSAASARPAVGPEGHRLGFPPGSWRDLSTPLDFLDLVWPSPFLRREALQTAWALLLGVAGCGLAQRDHHGGGVGVGVGVGGGWGERGRETIPGSPVATGMTRSLWVCVLGPCAASWAVCPDENSPQGGRFICIQPLAVWDPDHYSIKPIVSQQPSIT